VFKLFTLENKADAFLIGFSHMECEKNNNAPTLNPPSSEKKAFVFIPVNLWELLGGRSPPYQLF
jgi:hypothetical protein